MTISAIVCAYNEADYLSACLFSLLSQTRRPDEILVIDNASTDDTAARARAVPGVRVVDETNKGLVIARERARREARGDILAFVYSDCRAPISWMERVERRLSSPTGPVGVTGPYRFYDWDWRGRADPTLRRAGRTADPAGRGHPEGEPEAGRVQHRLSSASPHHPADRDLDLLSLGSSQTAGGTGRRVGGGQPRRLVLGDQLETLPIHRQQRFHKPKHLYSWKTLVRCATNWDAIARTLRENVDVALTLHRDGSWAA